MKLSFSELSIEKKLGVVAFVLGFVAIFLGNPYDGVDVKINTKDIALSTVDNADKFEVTELADDIIKQNADFRLIDLRSADEFKTYFIPGAANIPIAELGTAPLMKNEKIILYSTDDLAAAQGWFLLKAKGYNGVYILDGGLDAWKDKILFPKLPANASEEQKTEFNKLCEVSKFFGGTPQTDATETVDKEVKLPTLTLPASTSLTTPHKKKKREGC